MHCYFLISSYYLTVSNGHSLTTLKSVEVTQHSGSFKWGGPSLISSYYLTVSNGHSLTILKSIEVTQHSGSFKWGGGVNQQIYPKSANFELTCHFMLCFTEVFTATHCNYKFPLPESHTYTQSCVPSINMKSLLNKFIP